MKTNWNKVKGNIKTMPMFKDCVPFYLTNHVANKIMNPVYKERDISLLALKFGILEVLRKRLIQKKSNLTFLP